MSVKCDERSQPIFRICCIFSDLAVLPLIFCTIFAYSFIQHQTKRGMLPSKYHLRWELSALSKMEHVVYVYYNIGLDDVVHLGRINGDYGISDQPSSVAIELRGNALEP